MNKHFRTFLLYILKKGVVKVKYMKIGDFSKMSGVSSYTLRRWDNEGIFVALRTPTGERRYTEDMVEKMYSKGDVTGEE